MNKEYSIKLYDIQFYKVDADGNELHDEDGNLKLFTSSRNLDFSWVADSANADELVWIKDCEP